MAEAGAISALAALAHGTSSVGISTEASAFANAALCCLQHHLGPLQGVPQLEASPRLLQRAASGGIATPRPLASRPGARAASVPSPHPPVAWHQAAGPGISVAQLVSEVSSGSTRLQLAAAEQLAALAAAGARPAAIIAAAGGAQALLACVCQASAPLELSGTLDRALEAATRQRLCTAALQALCTLCQHTAADVCAAASASPAVTSVLEALAAGPDLQQRQAAAMLRAALHAAGGMAWQGEPPRQAARVT